MNDITTTTQIKTMCSMQPTEVRNYFEMIKRFQETVRELLIENTDYGAVQKAGKPSLWKSGAEKILNILNARPAIKKVEEIYDDHKKIGDKELSYYDVRVEIEIRNSQGDIISEGTGSCNTLEKKYCFKYGQLITDPIHYHGLKNTILKMAEKRALVDATLHISALSNLYTQDVEDMDSGYFAVNKPAQNERDVRKEKIKEWIEAGAIDVELVSNVIKQTGFNGWDEIKS